MGIVPQRTLHDRQPAVLRTTSLAGIRRLCETEAVAVVYEPPVLADWFAELARDVAAGAFTIERTILHGVTADEIADWLARRIPCFGRGDEPRSALVDDVLALVHACGEITGARRFIFRILTDEANPRCGYHVDTVPPAVSPWGLLRVYCGPRTEYVDPAHVVDASAFYAYLGRRERVERELRGGGDPALAAELQMLDARPAFSCEPEAPPTVVPNGAIVAFRSVDARLLWSDGPHAMGWIHRSPLAGGRRFVVNVNAAARS